MSPGVCSVLSKACTDTRTTGNTIIYIKGKHNDINNYDICGSVGVCMCVWGVCGVCVGCVCGVYNVTIGT